MRRLDFRVIVKPDDVIYGHGIGTFEALGVDIENDDGTTLISDFAQQ